MKRLPSAPLLLVLALLVGCGSSGSSNSAGARAAAISSAVAQAQPSATPSTDASSGDGTTGSVASGASGCGDQTVDGVQISHISLDFGATCAEAESILHSPVTADNIKGKQDGFIIPGSFTCAKVDGPNEYRCANSVAHVVQFGTKVG